MFLRKFCFRNFGSIKQFYLPDLGESNILTFRNQRGHRKKMASLRRRLSYCIYINYRSFRIWLKLPLINFIPVFHLNTMVPSKSCSTKKKLCAKWENYFWKLKQKKNHKLKYPNQKMKFLNLHLKFQVTINNLYKINKSLKRKIIKFLNNIL